MPEENTRWGSDALVLHVEDGIYLEDIGGRAAPDEREDGLADPSGFEPESEAPEAPILSRLYYGSMRIIKMFGRETRQVHGNLSSG